MPSTKNPPLLGALLRFPHEVLSKRLFERLHAEGFNDLQPAHHAVFRYPGAEGIRPSELVERLGISKQAVNELLQYLLGSDYLTLEIDEEDRRARRIRLTGRGRKFEQRLREIVLEIEHEWARLLGRARFAELKRALADLREVVETAAALPPPGRACRSVSKSRT